MNYDTATEEQLNSKENKFAITGPVEETDKPATYKYPFNEKIQLVDVPGVGSPAYADLATYCTKVPIDTYDTFLILVGQRVTDLELQLAAKIKSMKKPFFLVRTKIDVDENNAKRKSNPDIRGLEAKIRAYYEDKMKNHGITDAKVFLISNYDWDEWDFPTLIEAIVENLPENLKEALIMSLLIPSISAVSNKVKVLKGRFTK